MNTSTTRTLLLAAIFLALAPASARACICEYSKYEGAPPRIRSWNAYPRIFIGNALELENPEMGARPGRVKFVTEASWTGAMPDTVTVIVGPSATCALFIANARYLVIADTIHGRPELELAQCEDGSPLNLPKIRQRRRVLGEPTWTAPPVGRRELDAGVVRLGDPISRGSPADTIPLLLPHSKSITRFEIGDYPGPQHDPGRMRVAPGLYQYRVWFANGTSYSSYLLVRCESRISNGADGVCFMYRNWDWLDEPPTSRTSRNDST